eukprot:9501435-Pyramimonas_sp.AAC.1
MWRWSSTCCVPSRAQEGHKDGSKRGPRDAQDGLERTLCVVAKVGGHTSKPPAEKGRVGHFKTVPPVSNGPRTTI